MVKEAEANKESDKKKRESVDARNQADSLVFSTEKSLKEHGDKISAEGVVLAPSAFSKTLACEPSIMATHEFVVPKSIPITLLIV